MVTAQHQGFISRSQASLRPPRSISRNIAPQEGGVTAHYAGGPQRISPLLQGHTRCVNLWRAYQNHHMDTNGFADIAYTGGYCQHGYVFAGRGSGIRTAANGTNSGNYRFYAVCWIGGEGEAPTAAAFAALAWWIRELRRAAAAGKRVVPHSWHKGTGCPGWPITTKIKEFDNKPIEGDISMPHKHYDQMVLGANNADILIGASMASFEGYGLGLGLIKPDQTIEVVWPEKDAGRQATTDFAFLVGSANQVADRSRFMHGTNRVGSVEGEPDTRWTTAADVARTLLEHPPDTISRSGKPW